MIVTSTEFELPQPSDVAVCIIGAGAAGITLACELDGCGFKVLLLDAGGLKLDAADSSQLYQGSANPPHPNPSEFRRVRFGGTTGIWGGRCVPLDPVDFERREHVANSGWPISYDDVAQHYPRALEYCDAGAFDFSVAGSLPHAAPTIEGLVDQQVVLSDRIERYSLPTDFGQRYRRRVAQSANVTAVLHARCVALHRSPGGERIEVVEISDRAGRRRQIRARLFVLATGGIETPRLLLSSDPRGRGLGNASDLVGRYYACHFENVFGRVVPHGARVAFDFEKTGDGVYCRRKLLFSADAQREHRLLNMAFRLHFPDYSDAAHGSAVMSAIYLAKSTLIPEYQAILRHGVPPPAAPAAAGGALAAAAAGTTEAFGAIGAASIGSSAAAAASAGADTAAHLRNVVGGLPAMARFGTQWLFRRVLARRKLPYTLVPNADGSFPLEFNAEQTPQAASRVTLGGSVDRDGMRRVDVAWRLCEADTEAAQRAYVLLRDTLGATGTCRVDYDPQLLDGAIRSSVPLGGHHIGTTRMGSSPRTGVVDVNCSVFELPNLYVASSAVFCTSGHANPTLTIVALAIRLAAHLKSQLA
jgi:choline dehydrogenase-like flavoprotein